MATRVTSQAGPPAVTMNNGFDALCGLIKSDPVSPSLSLSLSFLEQSFARAGRPC